MASVLADTRSAGRPPSRRPRLVPTAVVAVLLVALLGAALVWWLLRGPSGPYADALDTLGEDTLRSSFTDWSSIGERVDVPDVEEAQDQAAVDDFLGRAYDADLVTGSSQLDVVPGLALTFGYSLAQAEWEAYGQAPDGAVSVLKLTDDVDFDEVRRNLAEAGYGEPAEDDGVWRGSGDLVIGFESPMTTLQINVLLLDDERLVLTSDSAGFLEQTRATIEGEAPSLRDVPGVDPLIEAAQGSESNQLWARDFACEDLALTSTSAAVDRDEGARLVEQAGGVHPLDGLLLARSAGDGATIAMWFDSEADAEADLQPRTDLARGPAPGQGGDFTDRFTITESRADGRLITMRVRAETASFMSDLGQGPVLFASC